MIAPLLFFYISASTWTKKNLEILVSLLPFCFVLFAKPSIWIRVKFALHLEGFLFYKLVSFMCVISKVSFPSISRHTPMEIPPMQLASLTALMHFIICLFYIILLRNNFCPWMHECGFH